MTINLAELLKDQTLKPHKTSQSELDSLRQVVSRELKDAAIEQLSTDRRFACYYNAALQLAHMVLAAAGYRINANKVGHHKVTLEIAGEILGDDAVVAINFFEMCRRKRHSLQYVSAGSISNAEIEQIKAQASAFRLFVEKWLSKNTNFS